MTNGEKKVESLSIGKFYKQSENVCFLLISCFKVYFKTEPVFLTNGDSVLGTVWQDSGEKSCQLMAQ